MESYSLEHMPTELSQIHLQLFKNVTNAAELRSGLVAAASLEGDAGERERERYDYCFIEAKTVRLLPLPTVASRQLLMLLARHRPSLSHFEADLLELLVPPSSVPQLLSRSHLLTAVHQALVAAARGTLATRTAHSEVLYALSPSNNVSRLPRARPCCCPSGSSVG